MESIYHCTHLSKTVYVLHGFFCVSHKFDISIRLVALNE